MSDLISKDGKLLKEIFGDKYLRRINTRAPVWKIGYQGSNETGFDDCIKTFLKLILDDFPDLYLKYRCDPISKNLQGNWISATE